MLLMISRLLIKKYIYISYIMVINYLAYISIFINYFIRCKSCFNKKICEMRNMLQTWERLNAFNDISTTYKIYIYIYIMVIDYLAYISIFINCFIWCKSCFNKKICEMRKLSKNPSA
jgi:hypothetical protein